MMLCAVLLAENSIFVSPEQVLSGLAEGAITDGGLKDRGALEVLIWHWFKRLHSAKCYLPWEGQMRILPCWPPCVPGLH